MERFRCEEPCMSAHTGTRGRGSHTRCLAGSHVSCYGSHLCLLSQAHAYSMDASRPLTQWSHLHHQQERVRCRDCGLALHKTSSQSHNGSNMLLRSILPSTHCGRMSLTF